MKNFKLITFGVVLFMLITATVGCKDKTRDKIIGVWQGQAYTTNNSKISQNDIDDVKMITELTFFDFNADSTFTETVFEYKSTGKWNYDSKTKKLALTYIIKNGPPNRANPNYEISSLTDKEMKCKVTINDSTNEVYTFVKRNSVSPSK